MPITLIRAIGWGTFGGHAAAKIAAPGVELARARSISSRPLAAASCSTASTGATILEQSSRRQRHGAQCGHDSRQRSRSIPGTETMVGAFSRRAVHLSEPSRSSARSAESFTIDPVHWYTDPFHNPIYYGVRIVRWGDSFGTMVDFIHSKAIARARRGSRRSPAPSTASRCRERARIHDVVPKFEFSHGHNMLMFTGLVRLPGIGARISPYTGLGAGVLLPHTEVGLAAPGHHPRTYEYNYAGPAAQALFGLEFRLSRMSFFVEYKFTWAALRRAAVAGGRKLAVRRPVAPAAALDRRRGAARRPRATKIVEPSGRGRAHGARRSAAVGGGVMARQVEALRSGAAGARSSRAPSRAAPAGRRAGAAPQGSLSRAACRSRRAPSPSCRHRAPGSVADAPADRAGYRRSGRSARAVLLRVLGHLLRALAHLLERFDWSPSAESLSPCCSDFSAFFIESSRVFELVRVGAQLVQLLLSFSSCSFNCALLLAELLARPPCCWPLPRWP